MTKSNKTRLFYVLCSVKICVFGQLERAQGPIYTTKFPYYNETLLINKLAGDIFPLGNGMNATANKDLCHHKSFFVKIALRASA